MGQQLHFDLAISQIHTIGPRTIRQLISYCGSSEQVFKNSRRQLLKIPGIGPEIVNKLKSKNTFEVAENCLEMMNKYDVQFYFLSSDQYPERLKHFADAPAGFFFKGQFNLNEQKTIAVVGTRTPSVYGKKMTPKIIEELQEYKPCIISGLALGIDALAHKAALENKLNTIAVLGQGLPEIYPPENRKLGLQIIEQGGLFTEFPFHKSPDPRQFPQRNRIIAMLADAVLVMESKASGGSMITANFAMDYFKDVFALPGRSGDSKSVGCNALIKSNKAALFESGHDIAEAMNWDQDEKRTIKQKTLFVELNEQEDKIFKILNDHEQLELDKLHYLSEVRIAELSSILLNLEFQGLIKSLPGKKYMPA
jgi:DNA processing protein